MRRRGESERKGEENNRKRGGKEFNKRGFKKGGRGRVRTRGMEEKGNNDKWKIEIMDTKAGEREVKRKRR